MYSDVHRIGTGQFNEFVEQLSRATDDTERVHLIRQYSNLGFFYCRQLAVSFPSCAKQASTRSEQRTHEKNGHSRMECHRP